MTYAIFDMDGTLADCEHRRHFITTTPKDFHAFYEAMDDDKPNVPIVELTHALSAIGYNIIICSGRPENYYRRTEKWLRRYDISFQEIYMRYVGDYRADHIIKREKLMMIRVVHGEPFLAVDDRQQVVDMWRSEGITCLQCAPGDF